MVFWGVDTEFLSGGLKRQNDVHSIQLSDGHDQHFFFMDKTELQQWFWRFKPDILFTWTVRPEFGSLKSWGFIGTNPYNKDFDRVQRFYVDWLGVRGGKHRTLVFDIQPFFKQMRYKKHGLGNLAAIGEFLSDFYNEDLRKLQHPLGDQFGMRSPTTPDEWEAMKVYGIRDSVICSRAAEWFVEYIIKKYVGAINIKRLFSWGTLAKFFCNFPELWVVRYYGRGKKRVYVNAAQIEIHRRAQFAGRNEALWTGRVPKLYYNDIASLYPCATCWTNALEIDAQLEPLTKRELKQISKPEDFEKVTGSPYGWLCGRFTTDHDVWGLPVRSETLGRNFYVVGTVPNALFSTFDLLAAHAKIETLYYGYKPVFHKNPEQQRYIDLTFKKLEGDYANIPEKYAIKGILNAATGKLGQAKPIAATSNFAAYSTIISTSHYINSLIFDKLDETVYYVDTDSFFMKRAINKTMLNLKNERYNTTVPIRVELRAESDDIGTIIFRSKHYYQNETTYTVHAWKWFINDWLEIIKKLPENVNVKRQIARTFKTRDRKAQELQIGRWKELTERFDINKLTRLFRGDDKRIRCNYDSYDLAQQNRAVDSRAWTYRALQLYSTADKKHKFYNIERDPINARIVPEAYVEEWRKLIS